MCVCEKKLYVKNNYMVFGTATQKPEIIVSISWWATDFQISKKSARRKNKMKLENQFQMHEFISK